MSILWMFCDHDEPVAEPEPLGLYRCRVCGHLVYSGDVVHERLSKQHLCSDDCQGALKYLRIVECVALAGAVAIFALLTWLPE